MIIIIIFMFVNVAIITIDFTSITSITIITIFTIFTIQLLAPMEAGCAEQ